MNKLIYPIATFIVAIGLYFFYISPTWEDVQVLRGREQKFDATLKDVREVEGIITELESEYAKIPTEDLVRLEKFLPTHMDITHTIYNISGVAARHGISLEDINVADLTEGEDTELKEFAFTFDLTTSYRVFKDIVADIEKSLQLANMRNLSITTNLAGENNTEGLSKFNVTLVMYAYMQ